MSRFIREKNFSTNREEVSDIPHQWQFDEICGAANILSQEVSSAVGKQLKADLVDHPADTAISIAGGVGFGLALSALPRWATVAASAAGGIWLYHMGVRTFSAVEKTSAALADAKKNPDIARKAVSENLAPIAIELSYMGLSGLAANRLCYKFRPSLRNDAHYAEAQSAIFQDASGTARKLGSERIYEPMTIFRNQFRGDETLKIPPGSFIFSRERFKDFNVKDYVENPSFKNREIRSLDRLAVHNLQTDKEVVIPTLFPYAKNIGFTRLPPEDQLSKIYLHSRDAIVRIGSQPNVLHKPTWFGTGFFVHKNGTLVTALHVIENERNLRVQLPHGNVVQPVTLAHDFDRDLAILKVPTHIENFNVLPLADGKPMKWGQKLFAFGHPCSSEPVYMSHGRFDSAEISRETVALGKSKFYRGEERKKLNYFLHGRGGLSGGPVLNETGEVVAVHTNGFKDPFHSAGFGTAVQDVKVLLAKPQKALGVFRIDQLPFKAKPKQSDDDSMLHI